MRGSWWELYLRADEWQSNSQMQGLQLAATALGAMDAYDVGMQAIVATNTVCACSFSSGPSCIAHMDQCCSDMKFALQKFYAQ